MSRTLIIEDSAFYRQLLKEALYSRFPSMELFEAADEGEALQRIEGCLPDLIFMDIKLPGKSGLELTKKIKTRYPDIPTSPSSFLLLTIFLNIERQRFKQKPIFFSQRGRPPKKIF